MKVIFYDLAKLFSLKLCYEASVQTEFVALQNTNLYTFRAHSRVITDAFHVPLAHQSAWFEEHELVVSASKQIYHVHRM